MQKKRHPLSFESGMRADVTPDRQPPGTYRDAEGMGLRFQPGESGQAMNLSALTGSERIASLPEGFDEVGSVEVYINDKPYLFMCLTNGDASQFGLLDIPSRLTPITPLDAVVDSVYTQLYTDELDPGFEKINWQVGNTLRVTQDAQASNRVRVIVNDRIGEPLFIPLYNGFADQKIFTPHPTEINGDSVRYPRRWSVNSFRQQPRANIGTIKFMGRGVGTLPTGSYRATFRYVLSLPGQPEEVTSAPQPPPPPFVLPQGAPNSTNHHLVFLRSVGVPTPYSLRFNVENPDQRWSRIELLVSYSADGESWGPWVVADVDDNPRQPFAVLEHKNPSGTGKYLAEGEIAAQWQTIRSAGDVAVFNSKFYAVGVRVGSTDPNQTINGKIATISPRYRRMEMDALNVPRFLTETDILTNVPLTPQLVVQERTYQRSNGSFATSDYRVDGDYLTYKGIQVAARYAAYRHTERYGIAALLLDEKGQPAFAIPLDDFVAPAIGDNNKFLTEFDPATGRYSLNILGLVVSNLRIPKNVIFDEEGVQRVGGVMIVRTEASGVVLHQGVITNLAKQGSNAQDESRLSVLPTFSNIASDTGDAVLLSADSAVLLRQKDTDFGSAGTALLQPGYVSYLSGDLLMEDSALVADKRRDSLHIVASAHPVYQPGSGGRIAGVVHLIGDNDHTYTKNYQMQTDPVRPAAVGRSWTGAKSEVSSSFVIDFWGKDTKELERTFDPENPDLSLTAYARPLVQQPDELNHNTFKDGYAAKGTVTLKVPGISFVDAGRTTRDPAGVQIANYRREVEVLAEGEQTYQTTGHLLAFTPQVLAELPQDATHYILNEMEVGGGDVYPTAVDMVRIYPDILNTTRRQPFVQPGQPNNETGQDYPDYAVSLIVPLECKYNLWLRSGRHFSEVATYPSALARGIDNLRHFGKSINHAQSEYWNVALATRLGKETVRVFKKRPSDSLIDDFVPLVWSELATAGETLHRLRRLPPFNFAYLAGQSGPPTMLVENFTRLYVGHPDAVGSLRIDERSQVVDSDGKTLLLGTGRSFAGVDYVIKDMGVSQWSDHWVASRAVYFVDRRRGKWARFSQAGFDLLSDRDGQHDRFIELLSEPGNPLLPGNRPVAGGYDPINKRVLISLASTTLIYNEDLNAFEMRWGELASRYHKFGGALLSRKPSTNGFFRHGTGITGRAYEVNTRLTLTAIAAPLPQMAVVFDILYINLPRHAAEALTEIRLETDIDAQVIFPLRDSRVEYAEGQLIVPLLEEELAGSDGQPVREIARLRSHVLAITLYFDTALSQKIIYLQSLEVEYRPSPRY